MNRILFSLALFQYFPVPTCGGGCDADLPEVDFDDCNPEVNYSEIQKIFIAKKTAAAFSNWKAAAEWTARMSAAGLDPNAIRVLTVIGDKPAGSSIVKEISNGRRLTIGKDHTVNFTIDDVSDKNYDFMRQLECGGEYRIWYETFGGKMFGGNEGVIARMDQNNTLARGRDEIETIVGTISWRSKFHPERATSPIFGAGNSTPIVPVSFDTTLEFSTATSDSGASINGTVGATDAEQKLEFNAIASPSGTPASMEITVGGVSEGVFDFPNDYVGQSFRYTDTTGVEYTGTFVNGVRAF